MCLATTPALWQFMHTCYFDSRDAKKIHAWKISRADIFSFTMAPRIDCGQIYCRDSNIYDNVKRDHLCFEFQITEHTGSVFLFSISCGLLIEFVVSTYSGNTRSNSNFKIEFLLFFISRWNQSNSTIFLQLKIILTFSEENGEYERKSWSGEAWWQVRKNMSLREESLSSKHQLHHHTNGADDGRSANGGSCDKDCGRCDDDFGSNVAHAGNGDTAGLHWLHNQDCRLVSASGTAISTRNAAVDFKGLLHIFRFLHKLLDNGKNFDHNAFLYLMNYFQLKK